MFSSVRYVFVMLLLSAVSLAAFGAPRWEIDESRLPPGLTKEKALKMLQEIDRKDAQQEAQEEQRQRGKADRARKAAKKYEDALAKAIERDPALKALHDKLRAGMRAMEDSRMSDEERKQRYERMLPDLEAFRRQGLAKSGIDEPAMMRAIGQALNEGAGARGDSDAGTMDELLSPDGGGFAYIGKDDAPLSQVTSRSTTTIELKAPWPNIEEDTTIGNNCSADKNEGKYTACATAAFVGAGTNRNGLAHFQTVPSGTTSIHVTTQLPETSFYMSGYAALGGSQVRTYSRIEVWDGSDRRLCRTTKLHGDLWAVVAWYYRKSGTHNVVLDCTFDAPAGGRDIVIKFVSDAFAQAWGSGIGGGQVTGRPDNVRIELTKPTTTFKRYSR